MYYFGYFLGVWLKLQYADVSEHSISSIFKGWMWGMKYGCWGADVVFIQGTSSPAQIPKKNETTTQYTINRPRLNTLLLYLLPPHLLTHSEPPTTCCPLPIGPATSSKPRPLYKYHVRSSTTILHTSHPALEDGTDRVFRNVGKPQSDAGEIPKRIHTFKPHTCLLLHMTRGYMANACEYECLLERQAMRI